jgi:adrenodoxin-NADP+ reductase
MQNVINQFTEVGSDPRISFFGNVHLGKDVSLHDLRKLYHGVGCMFEHHASTSEHG